MEVLIVFLVSFLLGYFSGIQHERKKYIVSVLDDEPVTVKKQDIPFRKKAWMVFKKNIL